jgi:hypothetical protein
VLVAHDDDRDGARTLKLFAAVFLLCTAIGVAAHPEQWYIPFALVGVVLALVVPVAALGRVLDRLRRCPRCGRRGFTAVFESEKETPAGDQFLQVSRCGRCRLHRLECGVEAVDLDPHRWEQQLEEWEGRAAGPGAPADRGLRSE